MISGELCHGVKPQDSESGPQVLNYKRTGFTSMTPLLFLVLCLSYFIFDLAQVIYVMVNLVT